MKSEATRIAVVRIALEHEIICLRSEDRTAPADALCDYLAEAPDDSVLRLHGLIQYHGMIRSDA